MWYVVLGQVHPGGATRVTQGQTQAFVRGLAGVTLRFPMLPENVLAIFNIARPGTVASTVVLYSNSTRLPKWIPSSKEPQD